MPETNDIDRLLDDGLGEQDGPEPLAASVPVPTDWEPSTGDELEADDA
jgi:hypothetical protein